MGDILFERKWAMPNGKTFSIKPIKEFIEQDYYHYQNGGG